MVHSSRVIPLDGRGHVPEGVRQWMGDSRGRWEGDTLVVETLNFRHETSFRNGVTTADLTLIERFTRVSDDTLMVRRHGRGSEHLGSAVVVSDPDEGERDADVRVRLPRGKLRAGEYPRRRSGEGSRDGRGGRSVAEAVGRVRAPWRKPDAALVGSNTALVLRPTCHANGLGRPRRGRE